MSDFNIQLDDKAQEVIGDVANKEHKLAKIVEALPTTDIDTNTIYMVLDQSASQPGNVYNEYLYINNAWELIGTTQVSGSGIEYVNVTNSSGTFDADTLSRLRNGAYIGYNYRVLIPNGLEPEGVPSSTRTYYYTSTVKNGKYYSLHYTISGLQTSSNYVIEEISVGGGIEYVELSYNSGQGGTITQAQATLLTNGAWVKMTDLAPYSLPMLPSRHAPEDGLLHFATALETTGRGEIYFREIIVDTQNLSYTVESLQIEPHQAE